MLKPGDIINETYRVEKLLGSGGMADVYVVTHLRMPRKLALKVMRIQSTARNDFLERFSREGEILATLRHPHIVDVTDRDQLPNGDPYLVMELLEGEDLATYVARTGALSVPVALRICNQIGEALEAAHKVGVIHRDLKPSNIFLSKQGSTLNFVKVLDFGIAKLSKAESDPTGRATPLTKPFALMGTPGYMAPEQARGENSAVGPATDQFALAATLYEMLAGKPAFYKPDDTTYATLERVITSFPDPLPQAHISSAVMRALAKKAEDRFQTLAEFLAAVGATTHTIYGTAPGVAPRTPGTLSGAGLGERTLPSPKPRLRRLLASLAAGAAIAGLVALVALGFYRNVGPAPTTLAPSTEPRSAAGKPSVESVGSPHATAPLQSPVVVVNGSVPPVGTTPPVQAAAETDVANTPAALASSPEKPGKPDLEHSPRPSGPFVPGTKPGGPAGNVTKSSPVRFIISMSGKTRVAVVDLALTSCAREHLQPLRLPAGVVITLERSGTLSVIDAPSAVHNTNFNSCVRQLLSRIGTNFLPDTATVKTVR